MQFGHPASMDTNACLEYSAMGYQSWDVAYGHCDAWETTLVRLEGRLSKGHDAKAKSNLRQKAQAGYCLCRTQATHVANFPAYARGALGPLKQTGIRLWAKFDSWAPRRLAAIEYTTRYINSFPPPAGWNRAAEALDFSVPAPIIRGIPVSGPVGVQTIAQTRASNAALPMLTFPMEPKSAEFTIQPAVNPTMQPKPKAFSPSPQPPNLPSGSAKQLNLSSMLPSVLWERSSLPVFREPRNKATSCDERDTAAPSGAASRGGASSSSNLFLQDHWRGFRRKKQRPPGPFWGPHPESPAPESSASSDWIGWRDWSE